MARNISYDKWKEAFEEFENYNSSLERIRANQSDHAKAAKILKDRGLEDEARAVLQETISPVSILIENSAKKAHERYKELSSKNNLESILRSVESDKLKNALDYHLPNHKEVPDSYKEAVALHTQLKAYKDIIQAIQEGNVENTLVKQYTIQALSEHFAKEYPINADPDNELIQEVLTLIAINNPDYRIMKFMKLADGLIKEKEKKFYEKIASIGNLPGYFSGVLKEKEIPEFYHALYKAEQQKETSDSYATAA